MLEQLLGCCEDGVLQEEAEEWAGFGWSWRPLSFPPFSLIQSLNWTRVRCSAKLSSFQQIPFSVFLEFPLEKVLGYPAVWNGVVRDLEYAILVWTAYLALGVKRLSFLPPESSPLSVWRTTDCQHRLATKELESWMVVVIMLMSHCSFKRKRKHWHCVPSLACLTLKHIFSERKIK